MNPAPGAAAGAGAMELLLDPKENPALEAGAAVEADPVPNAKAGAKAGGGGEFDEYEGASCLAEDVAGAFVLPKNEKVGLEVEVGGTDSDGAGADVPNEIAGVEAGAVVLEPKVNAGVGAALSADFDSAGVLLPKEM